MRRSSRIPNSLPTSARPPFAVARALAPHWAVLLVLGLFLVAGLAVLDEWGVIYDVPVQLLGAARNYAFMIGEDGALNAPFYDRLYSPVSDLALLFAERAFGLDDSRGFHCFRNLLIHLFFLTGGLFAYLLALRLFRNRLIALFAMLLILLHPRLYAHSFFNSKDILFLVAFVIALYLAHRAFRRDSLAAFALLGAAVGALVNLRIMGLILLAAIPAMRALDLAFAPRKEERARIMLTSAVFAATALLAAFALLPYLWADPVGRGVEWWTTLSNHPHVQYEMFRGTVYPSVDLPPEYLPVWFSITSPPFALLLGLIGAAAILAAGAGAPRDALRNTRLRFTLALFVCAALPIVGTALLDLHTLDKGRHFYFIWAPFSLLAAFGLLRLTAALRRPRLRAAACAAGGLGAGAALVSMALLHPNQQAAFNFFVDRVTPERLWTQYAMELADHPLRQALERLADQRPTPALAAVRSINSATISTLEPTDRQLQMLPRDSRSRIRIDPADPDALAILHGPAPESGRALSRTSLYGNTLLTVERKADLPAAYAAALRREPILRSAFDVYSLDGALVYVKEPCEWDEAAAGHFILQVVPRERADLPERWERLGYEPIITYFPIYGAMFDGKCVASVPLPAYPITGVRTGQTVWGDGAGERLTWDSAAWLDAEELRAAYREAESGETLSRGVFDVRLAGGALVYVKETCGQAETSARFFLHIVPEQASDLPEKRREPGFDNLDFDFFTRGGHFDGKCVASVPLPDYPVASARTGQLDEGQEIWSAEFAVGVAPARE